MEKMHIENQEGYICGMIYDEESGEIIRDAKVSSDNKNLHTEMPFKGIFFARGKPDLYRIMVSAENYENADVQIIIISDLQQRNIYLLRSLNVSQAV
jgi:hypothetical protein